ncbi:hypothetical protein [uncultured Mediterranean phage uvMED]|nr:hypothetical protein [uncultured Mediterranean phage uvMED]
MAVGNNLQASNAISKEEIVTVDRPVEIEFEYSSGDDVPVLCEVQAWGFYKGTYAKIGLPLYANRVSSSTQEAPVFRLDFAEIIGRHLDNTFKKTMNGQTTFPQVDAASHIVDQENTATNPDGEGASTFKFEAVAWCVNNLGFLERSDEDPVVWSEDYFVFATRITLPESFINGNSFSNLLDVNDKTFKGVCRLDSAANAALARYATSCPRNLKRTIHKDWGAPLGLITYNKTLTVGLTTSFAGTFLATGSAHQHNTPFHSLTSDAKFRTILSPLSLHAVTGGTTIGALNSEITFTASVGSDAVNCDVLTFNWVDSVKPNSKAIYWINDYNCLDYFLFDGGIEIEYKNKNSTFITNRDYKNERDASRKVMSGKTTEIISVFTTAMNKEALIWLQEIGRSRRVYEYNHDDNQSFTPIIIEDFSTTVLDSVKKDAVSLEIKYKRSLIATR